MIKCKTCENHIQNGIKHNCSRCETKTVYGEIQDQFIEFCTFYKMNETEKKRLAYYKKINSLPIGDIPSGGVNK